MAQIVQPGAALQLQPPAIAEAVAEASEAGEAAIGAQSQARAAKGRRRKRRRLHIVGGMIAGAGAEIHALERLRRRVVGQRCPQQTRQNDPSH